MKPLSTPKLEAWIERVLLIATALSAVAIVSILVLLSAFCLPLFTTHRLGDVLSWVWQPFGGKFGILPMVAGSLALSLVSLAMAFPVALGLCALLTVYARHTLSRILGGVVLFMTGIPTVVYGFVSVFLLVPRIRDGFGAGTGYSLLAASITLGILIVPTLVLVMQAGLQRIDPMLRLSAEALGLTPIQQMRHVFLPAASRSIAIAALLGFGRAVGDTLISLMLAGNAAQVPHSFLASFRTLPAHISLVVATDSQSMAYQSVFAAGLILFVLTGGISMIIGVRRERNGR